MKRAIMKIPHLEQMLLGLILPFLIAACTQPGANQRAVYMLLDTSGTYTNQLDKAQAIINHLLATLESNDSLAVARIDSGSFSERDIVAKVTFDQRPSVANDQKRAFRNKINEFIRAAQSSSHTDISGGLLQAVEYLNETGAQHKYILIFSDLKEDLKNDHVRDFPLPMEGVQVIALNVTKLNSDNLDPREYTGRLADWNHKVITGGGNWRVINDLDNVARLLEG
jgi:VCBS repeat-containing protein